MSDDVHTVVPFGPPRRPGVRTPTPSDGRGGPSGPDGGAGGETPPPPRPRLRKLRLLLLLVGLGALALVSTVFGMMMAVASDIPQIENQQQYKSEKTSYLYDDTGKLIGQLAPPTRPVVIDNFDEISPWMRRAVVAVEDKRFWSNPGVDLRGILRAAVADVMGGSRQGASTIAEQFVKNALAEQNDRTVLEKLREATLAFHLTHRWSKEKILREYLNSIYFGNGAYGIESASRAYFGKQLGYDPNAAADGATGGCGNTANSFCASKLQPAQAALLAGMIAAPGDFDPITHPQAATARRNTVLHEMLSQHQLSPAQYEQALGAPLPNAGDLEQPGEPPAAPYFTSWLRPQILRIMGLGRGTPPSVAEYRAYYGGLKIQTSLNLSMQRAAEEAIEQDLPSGPGEPTSSLVAIDNKTGEVRAMVGGPIVNGQEDYQHQPFNLATEGHRQPGSAFKPFTLAVALQSGIGPDSVWTSAPQDFLVPGSGGAHFIVHNFDNSYSGTTTLQGATDVSDNSVFAQVGIKVGTSRIARLARQMGIRSPVSDNYAMILGGLRIGVSALDIAHAYETFATGGLKVYNPNLGDEDQGPIGIHSISCPVCAGTRIPTKMVNHPALERILPPNIAQTVQQMLAGVVQSGTGTAAAINGVLVVGKTGTTSNYGDAWFVGWTPQLTTAVWVGFPNKLVPMNTLYAGGPVEGGTFPAIIWHTFMVQALQVLQQEQQKSQKGQNTTSTTISTPLPSAPGPTLAPTTTPVPASTTPVAPTTAPAPAARTPQTAPATRSPAPVAPSNRAPATGTPGAAPGTPGGGGAGTAPGGQASGTGGAGVGTR